MKRRLVPAALAAASLTALTLYSATASASQPYYWDYPLPQGFRLSAPNSKGYRGFYGGKSFTYNDVVAAVKNAPTGNSSGSLFIKENANLVANLSTLQECTGKQTYCGHDSTIWRINKGVFQYGGMFGALQLRIAETMQHVANGVITKDEAKAHFSGNLQSQVTVWMKTRLTSLDSKGSKPNQLLKLLKGGHPIWQDSLKRTHVLDAAAIIACFQIGAGNCAKGGADSMGHGVDTYACNTRGGKYNPKTRVCSEGPILKDADGFTGCLNGATLPAPEFVGPPSPGTEQTPDFTQAQPQLVLNSAMTGSEFESACEQQIELDLKGLGVKKMPLMPYREKHVAITRFGQVRDWYYNKNQNKNNRPRWHTGYDLSTHGAIGKRQRAPIIAPDDGTILSVGGSRSSMNGVSLRRAGTDHVVGFLHMTPSDNKVTPGQEVKAGDIIGKEGRFVSGTEGKSASHGGGVHLHLEYYVPAEHTGHYTPVVVPNEAKRTFNRMADLNSLQGLGSDASKKLRRKVVATDPTPFLPENINTSSGKVLDSIFGATARTQYCITRAVSGGVEGFSKYAAAQSFVENGGPCANEGNTDGSNTGEWAQWLPDTDGWGEIDKWLDMSPDGQYDYRSYLERALDIARYRFSSTEWATKIMHLSSLKLWQDYLLARRTETWLDWQLHQKREHINHMLAVLIAQRGESAAAQTKALTTLTNVRAGQ